MRDTERIYLELKNQEQLNIEKNWYKSMWVCVCVFLSLLGVFQLWKYEWRNKGKESYEELTLEKAKFNAQIVSVDKNSSWDIITFKCKKQDFEKSVAALRFLKFEIDWKQVSMVFGESISKHEILSIKPNNDFVEFTVQLWKAESLPELTINWDNIIVGK